MVTTRLYRDGKLVATDFPVAEVSEHLVDGETVWADFVSPTEDDLATIQEELGLHRLAVEDAVHEHQRPKLDFYDSHTFLTAYFMRFQSDDDSLLKSEVKAFITPHALVTVHDESFDISRVSQRWDALADLATEGVPFLVWGLLDVIVDSQFDAVRDLDSATDDLEDLLFDDRTHDREIGRRSFALRKSLVDSRRAVLPMRDVVSALLRHEVAGKTEMAPYFQDVYDHVLRSGEWTDTVRELIATVVDTAQGIRANRANLIMKKVTSWAAIIAVPTAITGFFGQNLLFPGYGTAAGTIVSSALIAVTAVVLFVTFRRNDWL
jgi:magnesium transporter